MRRLLLAVIVAFTSLGSTAAHAVGPIGASEIDTAYDHLLQLGIISAGDLSPNITRAELVAVLVRGLGLRSTAELVVGAPSFPDVVGHWASGYIFVAMQLNIAAARPDGYFWPNDHVNFDDAVGFLNKTIELPPNLALSWPDSYYQPAIDRDLINSVQAYALADTNITRGGAFALADRYFSLDVLPDGSSIYATYWGDPFAVVSVPEPATLGMLTGLGALALGRRPRRTA